MTINVDASCACSTVPHSCHVALDLFDYGAHGVSAWRWTFRLELSQEMQIGNDWVMIKIVSLFWLWAELCFNHFSNKGQFNEDGRRYEALFISDRINQCSYKTVRLWAELKVLIVRLLQDTSVDCVLHNCFKNQKEGIFDNKRDRIVSGSEEISNVSFFKSSHMLASDSIPIDLLSV